jgi:nitroreductase
MAYRLLLSRIPAGVAESENQPETEPIMNKTATTAHPILPLLAERWSPRAFTATKIDATALGSLFEAARWAPSASNLQPWGFVHAAHGGAGFAAIVGSLAAGNVTWAQHAPLLVVGVAELTKADGSPNLYGRYDLGQSVAHLSIQAAALGLHLHQMAGFDSVRLREAVCLPASHEPVVVIAVGTVGEASQLPSPLDERERAPRSRKPLDSFVFTDTWPAGRP